MGHQIIRRTWRVLLSTSLIAVAACGGSSSGPASTATPGRTQDPNAPFGGTLNVGVWQEPHSFLDANILDNESFSGVIDAPAAEGLLWYRSVDDTATAKSLADYYQPWLATEVPTVANGDVKTSGCAKAGAKMCVTWKLRSGVQWHDGSTFSAHDVCDTFQFFYLKYQGHNPTAVQLTTGWDQTIDCTEKDRNTAVVSFKTVFGPYLSLGTGVYGILPSRVLDKAFTAGESTPDHSAGNLTQVKNVFDLSVGSKNADAFKGSETLDLSIDGTGPYVFQSYTPTKQVVYVRNQNYWNKDHIPHLDKIVFKVEADVNAQINAAKSGDIDMGFNYQLGKLKTMLDAAKGGTLNVQTVASSGAEHIDLNVCANAHGLCGPQAKKSPYVADVTIRKAMLMGIDRQTIINDEASGKSTIPHDAWQYLGLEYALDPTTNPQTPYDPAAANRMLDDRGYRRSANCDGGQGRAFGDGTCITVDLGTTGSNDVRVATESLVQGDLARIGIHVNTPFHPNLPGTQLFNSFTDGGPLYTHNFDAAMYTSLVAAPAEFDSYYPAYHADCGGKCAALNQIPSTSAPDGQNATGEDNPALDAALDAGRLSVDLADRAKQYRKAEALLAKDLPDLPLYQQITVNTATTKLQEFLANDILWDFNSYDWYCTGGNCQAKA